MTHTAPRAATIAALLALASSSAIAQSSTTPKEQPPALGTPKAFHLPAKRELTLANGMRVTFVPFGTVPKVTITESILTGNADEGPNETWLADVTGDMLREGTTTRSALQLAEQGAAMGGSVSIGVSEEWMTIGGTVLSESGPEMIRLVADVTRNPVFPESQLPRIIAGRIRQVAIQRSQPGSMAGEKFNLAVYGDTPYGRSFPSDSLLRSYTVQKVRDFYAANYGAARTHLYVVGIFDQGAMERAVRESFSDWKAGNPASAHRATPKPAPMVTLIDRPNAPQSTIEMGLPVIAPGSPDYTALQVTDALLGGTFGSRITSNIRENKGYTYSPYSTIETHRGAGVWTQHADVTTKFTGASIKEIYHEIDRLRNEAPPEAELAGVKNNMIGLFTLQNASRGGIASMLATSEVLGLGDDYLTGYVGRVMAVTPADVQRVAREQITPDRMTVVVVGDRKTVEEQVAPFQKPVP